MGRMLRVGAQLVGKAFAFAFIRPLKPNEKTLLIWMAHTAKDTDPEPRYFASREVSAYALGFDVASGDVLDLAAIRRRESAFETVRKAIKGLVDAGAIVRIRRGREGQRAEFRLALTPKALLPLEPKALLPLEPKSLPGTGARERGAQGTTEEPLQEEHPGITPRPRAPHFGPVDNSNGAKDEL
jgi:hypothetical protein